MAMKPKLLMTDKRLKWHNATSSCRVYTYYLRYGDDAAKNELHGQWFRSVLPWCDPHSTLLEWGDSIDTVVLIHDGRPKVVIDRKRLYNKYLTDEELLLVILASKNE
jgi:hypothetical protein